MIQGYYTAQQGSRPPAPYVRAFVSVPAAQLGKNIDFLIDTGADRTCLHPKDIVALGVDFGILDATTRTQHAGIGGGLHYYSIESMLVFGEPDNWVVWTNRIFVCDIWTEPLDPLIYRLPSLIGRNFLNLCDIRADPSNNVLLMDPHPHEDLFLPHN